MVVFHFNKLYTAANIIGILQFSSSDQELLREDIVWVDDVERHLIFYLSHISNASGSTVGWDGDIIKERKTWHWEAPICLVWVRGKYCEVHLMLLILLASDSFVPSPPHQERSLSSHLMWQADWVALSTLYPEIQIKFQTKLGFQIRF